ncbi:hypothetical protein [Clostridium butyricum]|uniref:hypothetical protein n=1 Tax=Clostridium butyricum TaxID=1492 RepID=UPI0022E7130B|nr:hypothetical protein [Clostridium butyricum]
MLLLCVKFQAIGEMKGVMRMHHFITKYYDNGKRYAEAWIQINLFGFCFCICKKKMVI